MKPIIDIALKAMMLLAIVAIAIILYNKPITGRYITNEGRIMDTQTGNIYYYQRGYGFFYYEPSGVKHPIKQLPQ